MRNGVLENVDSRTQKGDDEKTGETAKSAYRTGADHQRLRRTHGRRTAPNSCGHGSVLSGKLGGDRPPRSTQEIEVTKNGGRKLLLHDAAARAARIASLQFAGCFHERSEERRVGKEYRSRWSLYH